MKKIFSVISLVFISLLLFSCKQKAVVDLTKKPTPVPTPEIEPVPMDPVLIGDNDMYQLTLLNVDFFGRQNARVVQKMSFTQQSNITLNEQFKDFVETKSGYIFAVGATYGTSDDDSRNYLKNSTQDNQNIIIVKYNENLIVQSYKIYGGDGMDGAVKVFEDHEGNLVIFGGTSSLKNNEWTEGFRDDYNSKEVYAIPFVIKLDQELNLLSQKLYYPKDEWYKYNVLETFVTKDESFILVSEFINKTTNKNESVITKLNASGEMVWESHITNVDLDCDDFNLFYDSMIDHNDNVYIKTLCKTLNDNNEIVSQTDAITKFSASGDFEVIQKGYSGQRIVMNEKDELVHVDIYQRVDLNNTNIVLAMGLNFFTIDPDGKMNLINSFEYTFEGDGILPSPSADIRIIDQIDEHNYQLIIRNSSSTNTDAYLFLLNIKDSEMLVYPILGNSTEHIYALKRLSNDKLMLVGFSASTDGVAKYVTNKIGHSLIMEFELKPLTE